MSKYITKLSQYLKKNNIAIKSRYENFGDTNPYRFRNKLFFKNFRMFE